MTLGDTERMERALPNSVRLLCSRLKEKGYRAWVVGGSVRDVLLRQDQTNASHGDWDVATDAKPEQVQRVFRQVVPTGIDHGTVTVLLDGVGYEVTTLRGEAAYTDGRRPDSVHYVDDIVLDLARRDFTVNAMAYDLDSRSLIDPFHGRKDLAMGILRAVGDPLERFGEDGLRVLRAARFVATLELTLEPKTASAISQRLDVYRKVSPERVRDEWVKAMKAKHPSRAFEVMREHGILSVSAPEMVASVGCEQNRHHAYDVWHHAMACLDACPPSSTLRMAGLLHDIGKPRTRAINARTSEYTFYEHERVGAEMSEDLLTRLRFSNEERARIVALVRHHLICYEKSWSDAAVRRWVRRVTPELLEDLYALGAADVVAKGFDPTLELERLRELAARVKELREAGAAFSTKELDINGHVLMKELGLAPGPKLGEILRGLLERVLDDPGLNRQSVLLELARDMLQGPGVSA